MILNLNYMLLFSVMDNGVENANYSQTDIVSCI